MIYLSHYYYIQIPNCNMQDITSSSNKITLSTNLMIITNMAGVKKNVPLRPNDPIMTQNRKHYYSALSLLFSQAIHSYAYCFLTPYSYEDMAGRRTFIEFSVEAHGLKTLRA